MHVRFLNYSCHTVWLSYGNGRLALELVAVGDEDCFAGEPIATATVNLNAPLAAGEIFVKDYAENEGMLDALIHAGVVEADHTPMPVGPFGADCARCRLTPAAREEALASALTD
ncbi:MAG: hypothetical protein VYC42_04110 [Pseudomonadota bacterium]|nr:hypothetical protein [Pseudomonadota bacterium]